MYCVLGEFDRMPEARDRLPREGDVMASYSNRRRIVGGGNRNSDVFILEEEAEDQATGTPFRWRGASMVGTPASMGVARRRGGLGSPRFGRSPNFGRSSSLAIGRENMSPVVGRSRGRGGLRGRGSILLPAWYPRKPLRDITAIVRVCGIFWKFIDGFLTYDFLEIHWWLSGLVFVPCMVLHWLSFWLEYILHLPIYKS